MLVVAGSHTRVCIDIIKLSVGEKLRSKYKISR